MENFTTIDKKRELLRGFLKEVPPPRFLEGEFSTENFLTKTCEAILEKTGEDPFIFLDRLCKKVDISKSLRVFYSRDLSEKLTNERVAPQYIPLFIAILLWNAEEKTDFKFLNTALKILDGILGKPPAAFPKGLRCWSSEILHKII